MKLNQRVLLGFFLILTLKSWTQETDNKKSKPTKEEIANKKYYTIPKDSAYLLKYEKLLLNEVSKYDFGKHRNGNAIQTKLFDENINNVFNTVVFANSDLATNGSAVGYQNSESKQTVSVNGVFPLKNSRWYLKLGINASGAAAPYNFYSNNAWSSGAGGSLGAIYKWKSSTFYNDEDAAKTGIARLKYIDSIVKVKIENSKKITAIDTKIKTLDTTKAYYHFKNDSLTKIKTTITDFKAMFDSISPLFLPNIYSDTTLLSPSPFKNSLKKKDLNKHQKAIAYIQNELYEFDKKNDITYGYSLHWFDFNMVLSNATYNFSEENVDSTLYATLNETLKFDNAQNKITIAPQFSYNYTRKSKNIVRFLQLGLGFSRGSFLSSNLITGTPKIDENQNITYESTTETSQTKGTFSAIKDNLTYGNFSVYGALFFGKKQKIGVNVNLKHNYLINKPNDVFYKNNFTALIGPVFKATNSSDKGVILGLDLGYDNVLYNTKVNNNFTARLRVGIPFNTHNKEEKKKK